MVFKKAFLFLMYSVLILTSCRHFDSSEKEENKAIEQSLSEADQVAQKQAYVHELGTVRKNIEQAANLYEDLYSKECSFNSSLVSNDFPELNTTTEKALALGKYASFFVYTSSYEQTQYADRYLEELLKLSEELGIREAFNEDQLRELANPDPSIDKSAVLTKVYLKATEQMYSEGRALLVSYMVLGGWIQDMEISYAVCANYITEKSVSLKLYDQSYSYYNCTRLLYEIKKDSGKAALVLNKLDTIKPTIEQMVKSRGEIDRELFNNLKERIAVLEQEIFSVQ